MTVRCKVNPSLALIKYWGKKDKYLNIPATSSLAVAIEEFHTVTELIPSDSDEIILNSEPVVLSERENRFFSYARKKIGIEDVRFKIVSENNFPTAAGLASSSSGFASISACILKCFDKYTESLASDIARVGSASAARAIYGGFTILKEGSKEAFQVKKEDYFEDLFVIFAIIDHGKKSISSRMAMEICSKNKDYYYAWLTSSKKIFNKALYYFLKGEFEKFGDNIVKSYQNMFALMLSSSIVYFKSDTIKLISYASELRKEGIPVFETMDAGPQVKFICLKKDLSNILGLLRTNFSDIEFIVSKVGIGLKWI